jgi:hypothetical protein
VARIEGLVHHGQRNLISPEGGEHQRAFRTEVKWRKQYAKIPSNQ